jgi:hypothetical protein
MWMADDQKGLQCHLRKAKKAEYISLYIFLMSAKCVAILNLILHRGSLPSGRAFANTLFQVKQYYVSWALRTLKPECSSAYISCPVT